MRIAKVFTLLTLFCAFATGCATTFQRPSPTANFGSPPVNPEAAVRDYFEKNLKDPESARYKLSKPVKAYNNTGLAYGGGVVWTGYLVDVEVNAKNSFGGYVGYKPYMVLFTGNDITRVIEGNSYVLIGRVAE